MKQWISSNKSDAGAKNQIGSGVVAVQENLTVGAGGVLVQRNVEGDIQAFNQKM